MTIVVEDGNNLVNSNSYVSVADFQAYASARGITISGDPEELLIKSMDYIESLVFKGEKFTRNQPLQWPRWDVVIDNFLVTVHSIPPHLVKGQIEVALAIDRGIDPISDIPRVKDSVSVGSISVTYQKNMAVTLVRKLSSSLWKVLKNPIDGPSFLVGRG
jgi:hypothetical protein